MAFNETISYCVDIDLESKKLMTKVIVSFINNHLYMSYTEINPIIKQILLEKTTGSLFIDSFDRVWDLEDLFRHFDAEIVDAELISSLDKLLHEIKDRRMAYRTIF